MITTASLSVAEVFAQAVRVGTAELSEVAGVASFGQGSECQRELGQGFAQGTSVRLLAWPRSPHR